MATYAQSLELARDRIAARIAEMSLDPKPNYSIDGESFSWQSLFDSLTGQLEKINAQLQMAEGGYEIKSTGVT